MDWNPLLNAVIREMNAGVELAERWRTRGTGEDPLLNLLAAMCKELTKLALLSKASPPTTASGTKATPSAADELCDWPDHQCLLMERQPAIYKAVESPMFLNEKGQWVLKETASTTQPTQPSQQSDQHGTPSGPAEPASECVHEWREIYCAPHLSPSWRLARWLSQEAMRHTAEWCQNCGALLLSGKTLVPAVAQTPSTSARQD